MYAVAPKVTGETNVKDNPSISAVPLEQQATQAVSGRTKPSAFTVKADKTVELSSGGL